MTEQASSPQAFKSVADLVAPMSFLDFHKEYWGKGFRYLPSDEERRAKSNALFTIDEFLETVFKVQVRDTRLSLTQDGSKDPEHENNFAREKLSWTETPTLEQLETMCSGKSTLIFNGVEKNVPKLVDFCRASMQVLGENVNINAYFSPQRGIVGLGSHFDLQEIFILHIAGSKTWRLHHEVCQNPIKKVEFAKPSQERSPDTEEFTDIIMQPGDVLYLPRGQWHRPMPTDEHSLHLTITIPSTFKFQAMSWLTKRLREDKSLHQFLPMILEDPNSHRAFIEAVEVVRVKALEILKDPAFVQNAFFDKFQESFAITADHAEESSER